MIIYAAITLLIIIVIWEWLRDKSFSEGFTDGVVPAFFGKYFPRRYDIIPGQIEEEDGWLRNTNYFEGYVDLQKLGYKGDFCRVVEKDGMPESRIMACALAGQEGLDSLVYRTDSMRAGMHFSRDDYFRDINGDGRDDYCRILKIAPDTWESRAVLAGITRFKQISEITDNSPPPHIQDLLWFYEGIMVWYRFFDDMLDYAENTQIKLANDPELNINKSITKHTHSGGLLLNNGKETLDQYIKIGENSRLEFDNIVPMRQLRAISVWVYFDKFTNNARIFDFGNGAGKDNIFLGIEGRGNPTVSTSMDSRPPINAAVCNIKPSDELSPQKYMETTNANINLWQCPGPEPIDSLFPMDENTIAVDPTANLIFEIWDTRQRKMRIKAINAIPLKRWVHIALTTTDATSIRPTWRLFIDGVKIYDEENGHLPLTSHLTRNYIGRSNWEGVSSQYEDADERFSGSIFDFRLYKQPMAPNKITRTVQWGKERLIK